MTWYSIDPRTRKYVKGYGFLSFTTKYKKQLLDKAREILGNKIAGAVTTSNHDNIEKQEPVEEIIISPEKRDKILNKLRNVL